MKNSCATRSSPTPLQGSRHRTVRTGLRCIGVLLLGLQSAANVQAHGEVGDVLPTEPGLRVVTQAAVRAVQTHHTLPSTRMDGVLLRGDAGIDPDGLQLQHATLAAAWRLAPHWGAYAAAGAHGQDPVHVEAAWLQWRRDGDAGQAWLITAGRQSLSMGPVLAEAGPLGPYALMPLAHRAAFDDAVADDGVQGGWRAEAGTAGLALDLGIWRGHRFPGGDQGGSRKPGLSLHAGAAWQAWAADLVWLQQHPQARAANTSPALGHSHGAPACDSRFTEVICFDGRAQLLGGSLRWAGAETRAQLPITLTAAGWWRRDDGTLESANGLAEYRGRTRGGWLDAAWHWHTRATLGWRHERLATHHRLHGPGAALLALEARMQHASPGRRDTLQLAWQPWPWARFSIEGGQETVAGQRQRFAALRLLLSHDWLMGALP